MHADRAAGRLIPWRDAATTAAPAGYAWSLDYRPVTDGSEDPADIFVAQTRYPQVRRRWWHRLLRRWLAVPAPYVENVRFRPVGDAVAVPVPGFPAVPGSVLRAER